MFYPLIVFLIITFFHYDDIKLPFRKKCGLNNTTNICLECKSLGFTSILSNIIFTIHYMDPDFLKYSNENETWIDSINIIRLIFKISYLNNNRDKFINLDLYKDEKIFLKYVHCNFYCRLFPNIGLLVILLISKDAFSFLLIILKLNILIIKYYYIECINYFFPYIYYPLPLAPAHSNLM